MQLLFPTGVYESWDSRFINKGYSSAFELQAKLNLQRRLGKNQQLGNQNQQRGKF